MMFDSLMLDDFRYTCVLLEHVRVPDGLGGSKMTWTDGMEFDVAFELAASPEEIVAEKQGVSRTYNGYVHKNMSLKYHDVFRRKADNKVFRVTKDGDDKKTPHTSTLDARCLELERWELPNDE